MWLTCRRHTSIFLLVVQLLLESIRRASIIILSPNAVLNPLAECFVPFIETTKPTHTLCKWILLSLLIHIISPNLCGNAIHGRTHTHTCLASSIYHWIYASCASDSSFISFERTHTQMRHRDTHRSKRTAHSIHGANGARPLSLRRDRCCRCVLHGVQMADEHAPYGFAAFTLCSNHMLASHRSDVVLCMNRSSLIGCRSTQARGVLLVISLCDRVCVSELAVIGVIPTLFSMQFDATRLCRGVCVCM